MTLLADGAFTMEDADLSHNGRIVRLPILKSLCYFPPNKCMRANVRTYILCILSCDIYSGLTVLWGKCEGGGGGKPET